MQRRSILAVGLAAAALALSLVSTTVSARQDAPLFKRLTALVEDRQKSLNKFKVPAREQGELIALLAPMRKDVVEKK